MKVADDIAGLLREARAGKDNMIYGDGWAGKLIFKFLRMHGIPVRAFVATDAGEGRKTENIPVYSLDYVTGRYRDAGMLVGVTGQARPDIVRNLERAGWDHYITITDAVIWEIHAAVLNYEAGCRRKQFSGKAPETASAIGYLSPGYLDTGYAEKRLIIGRVHGVTYTALPKEVREIPCAGTAYEHKMENYKMVAEAAYCPRGAVEGVGFIHTFNTVCITDMPWCASFETMLPRMPGGTAEEDGYISELIQCMVKENCRAMLPLCRNAYEIQKQYLAGRVSPRTLEMLMKKTHVLHPPQKVLVSEQEFEEKHGSRTVHFIFIGHGFFIKGGKEVIRALTKYEGRYDFDLTLVSLLQYNDYFTGTPYEEMVAYRELVSQKGWIKHYESLPNEKVVELCRKATVGLLPSKADTYGYSVLEMQAAGCPVVTTDCRAFPEINNDACGWVCPIPVDRYGFCTERDMGKLSAILQEGLEECFARIFADTGEIRRKGRMALQRIREMHDPDGYSAVLKRIMGGTYE